jgi:hypothetical protein
MPSSAARLALALAVSAFIACDRPSAKPRDGAAPARLATFTLAGADGAGPSIVVPAEAGQVELRMLGQFGDASELTAELDGVPPTDRPQRWPVMPTGSEPTGAGVSVVVPAYALPVGEFALTVWRGDAEVVRRVVFRVRERS